VKLNSKQMTVLIVGIILGYIVLPRVQAAMASRSAAQ